MVKKQPLFYRNFVRGRTVRIDDLDAFFLSIDDNNSQVYPLLLHIAVAAGHVEAIKGLLQRGYKPKPTFMENKSPLCIACEKGNLNIVELLMQFSQVSEWLNSTTSDPHTNQKINPLAAACTNPQKEIVKLLLEKGATAFSLTCIPLWTAVKHGYYEIAELLLQYGANVEELGNQNRTPLIVAIYNNNIEMVKLLLQHGANIHTKHKGAMWEMGMLYQPASFQQWELVKILVDAGADMLYQHFADRINLTPLHIICNSERHVYSELYQYKSFIVPTASERLEIAALLIEKGAECMNWLADDYIILDDLGLKRTPLHIAVRCKNVHMVWLLMISGANPHIPLYSKKLRASNGILPTKKIQSTWELCEEDFEGRDSLLRALDGVWTFKDLPRCPKSTQNIVITYVERRLNEEQEGRRREKRV